MRGERGLDIFYCEARRNSFTVTISDTKANYSGKERNVIPFVR